MYSLFVQINTNLSISSSYNNTFTQRYALKVEVVINTTIYDRSLFLISTGTKMRSLIRDKLNDGKYAHCVNAELPSSLRLCTQTVHANTINITARK